MLTHELNAIEQISRKKGKQTYPLVNIDLSLFGNFPLCTEALWAVDKYKIRWRPPSMVASTPS